MITRSKTAGPAPAQQSRSLIQANPRQDTNRLASHKRRRKAPERESKPPAKKRVKGKQGGLKNFMNLPIDIFAQIAILLNPGDLIVLARTSKFFRNLLSSRSATRIWRGSFENIPDLPSCPQDMCEPQYAALVFFPYCSFCGKLTRHPVNPHLRVRMCSNCVGKHTAKIRDQNKLDLIPFSPGYTEIGLRSDIDFVSAKIAELTVTTDNTEWAKWETERREYILWRQQFSRNLGHYLRSKHRESENQNTRMRRDRKQEIQSRLSVLGWTDKDTANDYWPKQDLCSWWKLVDQPTPLTERVWNNIRPKLTSLLEANVDRRLKGEKQERLLWVCMDIADIRAEEEASHTATLLPPFPQDSDISDWEMIRTIIEQQYSAEEADEIFDKHREQIQQAISTWRREAEQYFAGLIWQEYPDQTIPKPQIIRDSVDESLQSLSEDAAILLRADSLFHAASGADGCAYSYHNALALPRSAEPRERHTSSYFNWGSSMFRMHSRGSLIARTLLQEIGQPDASFLELREIRQFSCGRCGSIMLRTWEEMVSHYILEQAEWEKIQAHIPTFTELDIPYNCTHELTPKHDPLIKLLTTVEATTLRLQEARRSARQSQCRLCEKASVKYVELEDHTKIHIQTVHGIAEPDAVKHYKIKTSIPKGHRKRKGRSVR